MGKIMRNGNKYSSASPNNAQSVVYDNTDSGLKAENTKEAIDELNKNLNTLKNYSTEEQIIGTWIDGKPIYRKYFSGTLISDGTYNTLITENITVINSSGYVARPIGSPGHSVVGHNGTHIWNAINAPEVFLVVTDEFKGGTYCITLEYTKQ